MKMIKTYICMKVKFYIVFYISSLILYSLILKNKQCIYEKIVMLIAFMAFALSGYSQFEQGKYYVGASLTGLDLSYSGAENFNIGLDLKGGYLLADDWMITAQAGIYSIVEMMMSQILIL